MAHRKQADADRWPAVVKARGGMSYRQTAERFTVSRSVIVRLKPRMNQTAKGQECFWKRLQEKIDLLKSSPDNSHSALQTRCEANGLSTGALPDEPSTDVLTMQGDR